MRCGKNNNLHITVDYYYQTNNLGNLIIDYQSSMLTTHIKRVFPRHKKTALNRAVFSYSIFPN